MHSVIIIPVKGAAGVMAQHVMKAGRLPTDRTELFALKLRTILAAEISRRSIASVRTGISAWACIADVTIAGL